MIIFIPIIGTYLYIIYKKELTIKYILNYKRVSKSYFNYEYKKIDDEVFTYLNNVFNDNIYTDTKIEVLNQNVYYHNLINDLIKAKKVILIETFIIKDGKFLDEIIDILINKAKKIDVYFIYDDFASSNISKKTLDRMKNSNINLKTFNKYIPRLNSKMNFRNHRKLIIIDDFFYIGGINFSDEYINVTSPFGYWCDLAIKVRGNIFNEAVRSFFVIYDININNLNINKIMKTTSSYKKYLIDYKTNDLSLSSFITQNPIFDEQKTHEVLLKLINSAKSSIDIITPYIILDDELLKALKLKSSSDVRVRICIPHIPDKKLIYYYTLIYANELIEANVLVYEYLPGFIHSKLVIIDNEYTLFGSINLDYRSIYLHFEVSLMLKSNQIEFLTKYFNDVLNLSNLISYKKVSKVKKGIHTILKVFSPLL